MDDFNTDTPSGDTRSDCTICSGTGTCDMCEGSGSRFSHYDENTEPIYDHNQSCTHCSTGKTGKCRYCLGTGKYDPAFYGANLSENRLNQLEQDRSYDSPDTYSYDR